MEEIKIKLAVFEGPLDLLLHLIKKLEIDVYDIPVATITEQYMQYIHAMKILELEVAGEYLVKYAAEQLSEKAEERSLYYTKDPMDVDEYKEEEDQLRANQFNTIDLFLAFQKMIEKKKNRQVLETKISPDESTIDEKMAAIQLEMQHVSAKKGRSFDSFFTTYNKTEVVVTFMALLELMKKGTIRVEQTDNYASILLYPTGKEDE